MNSGTGGTLHSLITLCPVTILKNLSFYVYTCTDLKLFSIKTYPSLFLFSYFILSSCSYHHHYGPCVVFFRHITSQWQVGNTCLYIHNCILIIERQRSCSLWIWIVSHSGLCFVSVFSLKSKVLEKDSLSLSLALVWVHCTFHSVRFVPTILS